MIPGIRHRALEVYHYYYYYYITNKIYLIIYIYIYIYIYIRYYVSEEVEKNCEKNLDMYDSFSDGMRARHTERTLKRCCISALDYYRQSLE